LALYFVTLFLEFCSIKNAQGRPVMSGPGKIQTFMYTTWELQALLYNFDINSAKSEHENWINSQIRVRAVAETLAALTRPLCGNTATDRRDEWKMIDRRHRTTRV